MDEEDLTGDENKENVPKEAEVDARKKPDDHQKYYSKERTTVYGGTIREYNFNHGRRGLAVILNMQHFDYSATGQKDRDGTQEDVKMLKHTFMKLGFDVEIYDDLTSRQMITLMKDVARRDSHMDSDCFACAILSHGIEGAVFAYDGKVAINTLTAPFKGDKCPHLLEKPKLFFIQACRGTKFMHGIEADGEGTDADGDEWKTRTIPTEADVLVMYSTVPGFFSWRNNVDGSWFVRAIYRAFFDLEGKDVELMHILTYVNQIVACEFESCTDQEWTDHMKQIPAICSMLRKSIYFRPKVGYTPSWTHCNESM